MYTVLTSEGAPKLDLFGVVFVRTLAQARRRMCAGDQVVRWSNCGAPLTLRRMRADGRLVIVRGR